MNAASEIVDHHVSVGHRPLEWPRVAGVLSSWRGYGTLLRDTLWSKAGLITFGLVFFVHTGLYLYLSGMLLYIPNMTFAVPVSFPFVHIDLDPPSDYQPYLLFLPTDDFHILVNLTGALATIALSALVGLNAALIVTHWRQVTARRWKGGGFAASTPSFVGAQSGLLHGHAGAAKPPPGWPIRCWHRTR